MTAASDATADAGPELEPLLARVAEGDRMAFESLYRASAPRLFGICLRLLRDRGEAEDVLQEVFATVWDKAARYDAGKARATTWLSTVARNRCIDRLRAAPAARPAPVELVESLPDEGPTPAQQASAAGERARLLGCMEELEERRRGLIRTAFFEGATYEELARRIDAPLGTVKSWIRRGLLQLRDCLERVA